MSLANFIQRRPTTVFSGIVVTTLVAVGVAFDRLDQATPDVRLQQRQIATTPQVPAAEAVDPVRVVHTRLMGAGQDRSVDMKSGERKPL